MMLLMSEKAVLDPGFERIDRWLDDWTAPVADDDVDVDGQERVEPAAHERQSSLYSACFSTLRRVFANGY